MYTERQGWVAIANVFASNSNQREFELFSKFDGVVAILQFLHKLPQFRELPVHAAPVDDARFDDIIELENDQTVSKIGVEPINIGSHTQRIHPIAVSLFLAALLQIFQGLEKLSHNGKSHIF